MISYADQYIPRNNRLYILFGRYQKPLLWYVYGHTDGEYYSLMYYCTCLATVKTIQ